MSREICGSDRENPAMVHGIGRLVDSNIEQMELRIELEMNATWRIWGCHKEDAINYRNGYWRKIGFTRCMRMSEV